MKFCWILKYNHNINNKILFTYFGFIKESWFNVNNWLDAFDWDKSDSFVICLLLLLLLLLIISFS